MFDQMKVGVSLTLTGDAPAKIKAFQSLVSKSATATEALNTKLESTNIILATFSTRLEKLNPLLQDFYTKITTSASAFGDLNKGIRASSLATGGLGRSLSATSVKMANATRSASLLKDELVGLAAAGGSAELLSTKGGGGGRGTGGGGHGGMGIHGHTTIGPYGIGAAAFGGLGLTALGAGFLLSGGYKAEGRFQQAQMQFAAQGFGDKVNAAATHVAETTHLKGISQTDMMQAITDALTITKDPNSAMTLAPQIAKMNLANQVLFSASGAHWTHQMTQSVIQTAEKLSGSTNPAIIGPLINMVEKAIAVEGGPIRLSPLTLNTVVGQMGPIQKIISAAGFQELIPIIQASKQRGMIGTQYRGIVGSILSGKIATPYLLNMEALGLVDPAKVIKEPHGLGYLMKPQAFKGADLIGPNMVEWVRQDFLPLMRKKGLITPGMTDAQQNTAIATESFKILPKAYAGLIAQIADMMNKIDKFQAVMQHAKDTTTLYSDALRMNAGATVVLSAAWEDFNKSLGKATSPTITTGLLKLADWLEKLSRIIGFFGMGGGTGNKDPGIMARHPFAAQAAGYTPQLGDKLWDKVTSDPNFMNWAFLFKKKMSPATAVAQQGQSVTVQVDGRTLFNILMPYMDQANYNAAISSVNSFNLNLAATPPIVGINH